MKHLRAAMVCGVLCAAPLAAQKGYEVPPWHYSNFPYVTVTPNDGLMGMYRLLLFRMPAPDDRVSLHDAVSLEAGYSTKNAYRVALRAELPRIAEGWRVEGDAQAWRSTRFGDPDRPQRWTEQSIAAEVTRRIAGPLSVAVRGGAFHVRDRLTLCDARDLYPKGPATGQCIIYTFQDGTHFPSGDVTLAETDVRGRAALVLDLRDREFDTQSGALVQAGVFVGVAGSGYHGAYGLANYWMAPLPKTRVTARAGFRALSASSAFSVQHEIPAWEGELLSLGGFHTDRALATGELAGRGQLLAGVEVRQQLKQISNIAALSVLGFVDAGRAFTDPPSCTFCGFSVDPVRYSTNGDLKLTLKGWTVGAGGGISLRVLRNAQLTFTAARANQKTRMYLMSGWSW